MSPEDAEKLIMTEWSRIKEKFIKHQETKKNDTVDNMQQLDKAMGMAELITLYRDLFYGRQDVFAVRWDNDKTGAHGYAPKCNNEWDRNICGKSMKIKKILKILLITLAILAGMTAAFFGGVLTVLAVNNQVIS